MTLEELFEEGNTIKEIAEELGISFHDVKKEVEKLNAENLVQIIDWELSEDKMTYIPVYGYGKVNRKMPKPLVLIKRHVFDRILFGDTGMSEYPFGNYWETFMKPSEILKTAKEKINSPEKWTKGALARDKFGAVCGPRNTNAVCFCSLGAVQNVTTSEHVFEETAYQYLRLSLTSIWPPSVQIFNDEERTTHADVMSLFDRAIALAESEGN